MKEGILIMILAIGSCVCSYYAGVEVAKKELEESIVEPDSVDEFIKDVRHGEYRRFFGKWDEKGNYSGDRFGCDVYCSKCNTWNTVEGTGILYSVIGECKKCNQSFLEQPIITTD